MSGHRIVSLIASATEIVAALGREHELVGRSHECDWPRSVASLPECSAPRIDVHGSSRQIDERVKRSAREALSVYRVFPDVLEQLQPTVILTQTQCEVCAVSLRDVEEAVCRFTSSRPRIVSLEPMSLGDVWQDVRRVAEAIDAEEAGEQLVADGRRRLEAIREWTAKLESRPAVACIEWLDPLMTAGNWVPELVEIAGGVDPFGTPGEHAPWTAWGEIVERDPEVIALMPCGFDIARTLQETSSLTERPGWQDLQAVRAGRVYVTDGNQYFNRPGPRVVESAEILAELLHTEQGDPRAERIRSQDQYRQTRERRDS